MKQKNPARLRRARQTRLKIREIGAVRPPEPYKGKGVRYANEVIVLKETKKK